MNINIINKFIFFPLLLLNISIGGKINITETINFGQLLTWISILIASAITFNYVRHYWLSSLIIFCVVLFKSLELISPFFLPLYIIFVGFLYALTGSIILTQNRNMIYHQVMFFTYICVLFQFMQLVGVWKWPYYFATHYPLSSIGNPGNTVFVDINSLNTINIQHRPSGIFSSATFQSLFTALAITLHFTHKGKKFPFGSLLIILLIIFSGSKYPLVAFIIILSTVYFFGGKNQKKLVKKTVLLSIGIILVYSIIFPGIVNLNYNPTIWLFSIIVRFNDIITLMYPDGILPQYIQNYYLTYDFAQWESSSDITSGIAFMAKINYLIYFLSALIAIIILYIKSYKKLINRNLTNQLLFPIACLLISISFIPMFNIFANPLYWFIIGGTLLPLFINKKNPLFSIPKIYFTSY